MDKVIIYRISWYETSIDTDLDHILAQLNTIDTDLDQIRTRLNTIDTNLNDIRTQLNTIDTDTNLNDALAQLNTFVRKQQADTITATHTFDPTEPGPAFQLGPNAQNQLIQYLNADKVDGFDASRTPAPNVIPVADSSGTLSGNWIPSMFNSVVVITPTSNTIYQEPNPCLIMVSTYYSYNLQISPDGTTWYGLFEQFVYHNLGSNYYLYVYATITFYVPKNWYWKISNIGSSSYCLKLVFNF
jgi:hypothetical protein